MSAAIVRHEVMTVTMDGKDIGKRDIYWAECSECSAKGPGWVVGHVSAPNAMALEDAETHECGLPEFSAVAHAWSEFWNTLIPPAGGNQMEVR